MAMESTTNNMTTSSNMAEARAFIDWIRRQEVPILPAADQSILYTMYKDLADDCFILLNSLNDDVETLTTSSGKVIVLKVWTSERALCTLIKKRLVSKMKRWPQSDGDKVQTIGVRLLKMLLYEMEARKVGKDKIEKMVTYALAGYKEKNKQMELEKKNNGDAFDDIKFKAAALEKGAGGFEDSFDSTGVENGDASEIKKVESTEIEEGEMIEGVQFESTKMDMDHTVEAMEVEPFPELDKDNAVEVMEVDASAETTIEDALEGMELDST